MLYCLFLPCRPGLHCVIHPDLGVLSDELSSEMLGEAREFLFCRTSKLPISHLRLLMCIALKCQTHNQKALHLPSGICWDVWVHIRFLLIVVCAATRSFDYCNLVRL